MSKLQSVKDKWVEIVAISVSLLALGWSVITYTQVNWEPSHIEGVWLIGEEFGCSPLHILQANRQVIGDCLNGDGTVLHLMKGEFVDKNTVSFDITRAVWSIGR